ncbi:MAG: FHIPEP family type III secretion protein, partial [Mariprofundaceae bacterium]|nr:FHIPEP family type III secretion protein [Mariprofundaceae bacterium]
VPSQVPLGLLQNVLQRLLAEWVPIRDLMAILETLADNIPTGGNIDTLVEHVRTRLGRSIVQQHLGPQGELKVFTVDPQLEETMIERVAGQTGLTLPLDVQQWQRFATQISNIVSRHDVDIPLILTSPPLRPALAHALGRIMPRVAVLSIAEIPSNITVNPLDQVGL